MSALKSSRVILEQAVAARVFPGAVVHFSRGEETLLHEAVGMLGYAPPFQIPVSHQTFYDLASVSKMYTLATVLSVLRDAKIPL